MHPIVVADRLSRAAQLPEDRAPSLAVLVPFRAAGVSAGMRVCVLWLCLCCWIRVGSCSCAYVELRVLKAFRSVPGSSGYVSLAILPLSLSILLSLSLSPLS